MTLIETTCCHARCGITWGMQDGYEAQKRRDKTTFYCPNGHAQYFIGESDAQRANREQSRADNEAANAMRFRRETERLRRELKTLKKK